MNTKLADEISRNWNSKTTICFTLGDESIDV